MARVRYTSHTDAESADFELADCMDDSAESARIPKICVRNYVKLGVPLRILYCVMDTGYGLGGSLRDCRTALPKGRKYQMVKTQTVPR